jgi:hypothetical protein
MRCATGTGYETKERVLDGVVALLHKITRTSDYVGRTADDRLIAVVPHTDSRARRSSRGVSSTARARRGSSGFPSRSR